MDTTKGKVSTSPQFDELSKPGSEGGVYEFLARDVCPDFVIRLGVGKMLAQKLREEYLPAEKRREKILDMVRQLKTMPVAISTDSANEQHYMVPTEFFKLCLGKRLKYSCAYFDEDIVCDLKNIEQNLDRAEEAMLAKTVQRAQLKDGQEILELGCGWGSLTLYMAEKFPAALITAVSNSSSQREYIESQCRQRGLTNVRVITCDMNDFAYDADKKVDRVVSVEMFEHMKNYGELMRRISTWLKPGGKLFVHIFSHPTLCYHYQDSNGEDWLTRNFFTGGIMPSNDLLLYFQDHLKIEDQWAVSGKHYQLTARAWLNKMDANKATILPILAATYGAENQRRWWVFWRLFFIACEELWGFRGGEEWMVSHYLFVNSPEGL